MNIKLKMQYKNGFYKIHKVFSEQEFLKYTPIKKDGTLQADVSYFNQLGIDPRSGYENLKNTKGYRNLAFNIYHSSLDYNNEYIDENGNRVYIIQPKNLHIIGIIEKDNNYIMEFYTNVIDKIVTQNTIVLKNNQLLFSFIFDVSDNEKAEWQSERLSYRMIDVTDTIIVEASNSDEYKKGDQLLVSNTGISKDNIIDIIVKDRTVEVSFLLSMDNIIAVK